MAEKTNLNTVCKPSPSYIFPFSARRYRQYVAEGVLPPVVSGNINLGMACRMLMEHQQKIIEGRGSSSYTDEKRRKTKLEADRKELELERMRGEVISTEKAMNLWGMVCFSIRSKLLSIPSKIAPLLHALGSIPEIKERLEVAVYEVLNELANPDLEKIARVGGNRSNIGNLARTNKANGVRVGRRKKILEPGK